jgi:hypothetical protein
MRLKMLLLFAAVPVLVMTIACSSNPRANNANSADNPRDISYKDNVKKALEQADLKDVTVDEDRDKNTITLGGTFIRRMPNRLRRLRRQPPGTGSWLMR